MKEKKTAEIPQKIYKLYLEQRRLFEASREIEVTKVSMELSEIEYVNPYLSSMILKSIVSGEYYGF